METLAAPAPLTPPPPAQEADLPDDDAQLTRLDPAYKTALRISAAIAAIPFAIGALVLEGGLLGASPLPYGVIFGLVVFVALVLIIRLPGRRWQARGYHMSADRLRVVRGILWHSDTIVPFGRVQHIDLDQGPIERALGIATLTLHTAGNHNASVSLPGLRHDTASAIREEIRQHIRRDSL